jgi:hypothetical protein
MANIENRQRRAVETILEDESLSDGLIDEAAKLLLDWGIARAKSIVQQSEDLLQEDLDKEIATLRREAKRISRQARDSAPDDQANHIQALLTGAEATPGDEE